MTYIILFRTWTPTSVLFYSSCFILPAWNLWETTAGDHGNTGRAGYSFLKSGRPWETTSGDHGNTGQTEYSFLKSGRPWETSAGDHGNTESLGYSFQSFNLRSKNP